MKQLWIIDLSESKHSRLQECIAFQNKIHDECWIYTTFDIAPVDTVMSYKSACQNLLNAACEQVNKLLENYTLNSTTFQICVLGDIASRQTRDILPFVSIYLKSNWYKVIPNHVGVGVEIGAFFYVPSNLNLYEKETMREYAVFLESLNLLHKKCMNFFYDFVVPFGDVQPIGQQTFSLLSPIQLDELLFQYLLNIYWSGISPLSIINKRNSPFGAMGAAGYFYDVEYVKKQTAYDLLNKLIILFRKRENEYDSDSEIVKLMEKERRNFLHNSGLSILNDGNDPATSIFSEKIDVTEDLNKIEQSEKWHPVWHFNKSFLMSNYYLKELRYLPARLNEYLNFYKASLKKEISRKIHNRRLEQVENTRTAIDKLLENYWNGPDFKYKVISQQEEMLKDIIAKLELEKKQSESQRKNETVNPVLIPSFLQNEADEIKAGGSDFSFRKILEQLKAILQKEPTIMSVIVRAILLGTTGIFCLLPLLKLLSPEIINLGQIVKREYLWAIIIFVFPFSFLLFWKVRRHFKLVKKMKRRLWAYILLQLKDNVDSIISNEVNGFYDDVIHYCNEKADDFERLRNSMYVTFEIQSDRYLTTFFNRPLDEFISDKTLLKENIDVGVLISVDEMKEEHLYMLLNNCAKKIGYEVLDVIPSGNEELKKHVTDYIHRLFNEILQSLQEPVEANELIKAWLYSKDGISELGKCLGKAYPVGLFVDNFTDSIYNNCRINHILFDTERFDGIDWLSDSYADSNLLFITRSLGMDSLVLSRILNNYMDVNIEFPITTQVELACYYAYYSTNDKECAYFRNMLISSARLNTIHNELTN